MSEDKLTVDNSKDDNVEQIPIINNSSKDENFSEIETKVPQELNPDAMNEIVNKTETASDIEPIEPNTTLDMNESNNDIDVDKVLVDAEPTIAKQKNKFDYYKLLRIVFSIGFVVFAALFINEVLIQPYRMNKSIELTRELYNKSNTTISTEVTPTKSAVVTITADETQGEQLPDTSEVIISPVVTDPNRDDKGRLLQFRDLLYLNEDVKGWITIPDTNIDYVVMQSNNGDPEYYLTRDIEKQKLKAGSLFLDYKSSIEKNTQNLVIHGHNMTSSDDMFHYLLRYKELAYYKERPVFTFDTILQTGQWKIFSIIVTNGTSNKEPLFNYTRSVFKDSSDFLNFVYQLRIRSVYNMDDIDINENDQILTLSTCSYEVKDYRTVIIARKVREGEEATVDVDNVTINSAPLYPGTWYYRFGGKAPEFAETFEEALENGDIKWYTAVGGE
ncbi:MAG: sortase domain-containing protein [Mobilitalea sp.]